MEVKYLLVEDGYADSYPEGSYITQSQLESVMQKGLLVRVQNARKVYDNRKKRGIETGIGKLELEQAAAVLKGMREPLLNEIQQAKLYLSSLEEVAEMLEWST